MEDVFSLQASGSDRVERRRRKQGKRLERNTQDRTENENEAVIEGRVKKAEKARSEGDLSNRLECRINQRRQTVEVIKSRKKKEENRKKKASNYYTSLWS